MPASDLERWAVRKVISLQEHVGKWLKDDYSFEIIAFEANINMHRVANMNKTI
jgi:hypothetical protein